MLCQLDSAAFYLAVRSGSVCPADVELNRRLRNVGIPKRRGQGPVNRQRYSSAPRLPSPTSILTFALPTSPAALSVGDPSRTVLEQRFRPNKPSWRPNGRGALMTATLSGVTKKKAWPSPQNSAGSQNRPAGPAPRLGRPGWNQI